MRGYPKSQIKVFKCLDTIRKIKKKYHLFLFSNKVWQALIWRKRDKKIVLTYTVDINGNSNNHTEEKDITIIWLLKYGPRKFLAQQTFPIKAELFLTPKKPSTIHPWITICSHTKGTCTNKGINRINFSINIRRGL
jgi:hypothetical protein